MKEGILRNKGAFDSQNVAFWSESEKCYVCYFRTWSGGDYSGYRTVSRATSDDFLKWSEPVAMNFGDTPPEHLYTQQTSPYFRAPHIYVAISGRFMPGRQVLSEKQALSSVDGITSISATYKGGEALTRPFSFTGHNFEINYSTSAAGEIRFEIQDENGVPIPGYSLEDSQTIIGNEIARVVFWKGEGDLQNLSSRTVRLRIYMKDADLYSIRFK